MKMKHLEHVEDLIIEDGVLGGYVALSVLSAIVEKKPIKIQEKIDGSPSIVAGINPENGKFFVGTKSVFNKKPKLNYTVHDIRANHGHSAGLCRILRTCLLHLPVIIEEGIWQGDLLYDKSALTRGYLVECASVAVFTPNTIQYKIRGPEVKNITNSYMGIVWHTKYSGSTVESLHAETCSDVSVLNTHKNVWTFDPTVDSDEYSFSVMEKIMFDAGVKHIQASLDKNHICSLDDTTKKLMKLFINSRVSKGKDFVNKHESLVEFVAFVKSRYDKYIEKFVCEKAIDRAKKEKQSVIDFIISTDDSAKSIMDIFEIHAQIQELKALVIDKLNSVQRVMESYYDGKETGPEGFVVSAGGGTYKLVNRLEFSRNNFNNIKKWK